MRFFSMGLLLVGIFLTSVLEAQLPDSVSRPSDETDPADLLADGQYRLFLETVKQQSAPKEAKARSVRNLQKFVALYESGRYREMEKVGWKLPRRFADSFFVKYLSMQAYFARKRFKQAAALHEELEENYPLALYHDRSACMDADIALYRRHWEDADSLFEECIDRVDNAALPAYRHILAKEKGHFPKRTLLKDYMEYDRLYPYSPLVSNIRNRLKTLFVSYGVPKENSPLFTEWLSVMERDHMLESVLKEDWFQDDKPAFALISYLLAHRRFSDAYELAKRGLNSESADNMDIYRYGWRMYRALLKGGKIEEAADHLLELSEKLETKKRQDRARFFAAFAYEEAGRRDKAVPLFEKIVYAKERSPYFLLSLYRLGLHYLRVGNEWYTATLWSNFLLGDSLSAHGQYGGARLLGTMEMLTEILNKKNGFYALGGESSLCDDIFSCDAENHTGVVSYYDFLWMEMGERRPKITFMDTVFSDARFRRWEQAEIPRREELTTRFIKESAHLPLSVRKDEYIVMMKQCAKAGLRSCVDFYVTMLFRAQATAAKPPAELKNDADSFRHDSDSRKLIADSGVLAPLLLMVGRYADFVDYSYSKNRKNLPYAPNVDSKGMWKALYPLPYRREVLTAARRFKVPPALIYSIMRTETFYRPNLTSSAGAVGLMQIMPITFEKIAVSGALPIDDPFNPRQSVVAAVWYLGKLLKRFGNNPLIAAAAYNAGPHNVSRWLVRNRNIPFWLFIETVPFRETRRYMKKVARYMEIYSYIYEGNYYDVGLHKVLRIKERPEVVNF